MTSTTGSDTTSAPPCPTCGASLAPTDRFCESCGTALERSADGPPGPDDGTAIDAAVQTEATDEEGGPPATAVVRAPGATAATCLHSAGSIDDDGFCSNCGARGRTQRDHWTESPASWVGGVCDIGERHARNEDAMAMWVDDAATARRAVLVVCDGVTTAPHSDRASLAAAADSTRHMADVLTATDARSVAGAIESATDALVAGCRLAQVAVLGVTRDLGNPTEGPSCTFAAAIVADGVLAAGWCGDSRVYWMPDHGAARQVSVDHSLASVLIAEGASRDDAESDPTAHTITRWLGADSFEPVADTATVALDDSGWVVVCSDGLWNYASEAGSIGELLSAAVADGAVGPTGVAESLAATANLRGGHDNVTVVLARIEAEDLTDDGGPIDGGAIDGGTVDRGIVDGGAVDEAVVSNIGHSDEADESVERGLNMATFTADVFENEYLPEGATDVHAVVSVTCSDAGSAGQSGAGQAAEIILIDTSGSMDMPSAKIAAARRAAQVALDEITDGTLFAVVAGNTGSQMIYPFNPMLAVMDQAVRDEAKRVVGEIRTSGATTIGSWINSLRELFLTAPSAQRHAILLTDGKQEGETPAELDRAVEAAKGVFQCDCRGVGDNWKVDELRRISTALLGTVDIIPSPEAMEADFEAMIQRSMGRGVADAGLRVWAPEGSEILFVRQVAPVVEDLSDRAVPVTNLIREYPTGAWGDESRDYHVAIRVPVAPVGSERLAARVEVVLGDEVQSKALVRAVWSEDTDLTTRINPAVAHYTGQVELADAIQQGLAARDAGDDDTATLLLGKAAKLAHEGGNEDTTRLLRKVVDIEDPDAGTVRLRTDVEKIDEMALDTRSTKTIRIRKPASPSPAQSGAGEAQPGAGETQPEAAQNQPEAGEVAP